METVLIIITAFFCIFVYGFGIGFTISLLEQELNKYYEESKITALYLKITRTQVTIFCIFLWYIILPTVLGLKLGSIVLKSARETFFTLE